MKELLEKILGQIKKTPEGVRAYEDLYHICLETQKTDIPLSVEYLKKLSDIIENRIPQSETDKELRSLFMLHKKVLLAAAPFDFESYLLYVEWEREPDKKFYVPRREVMHPVVQAMQDLIDDRLDLLTISMPPGTGKSTLGIFFLSWVMGRFPDSQSLASAHSGMLTRSFYDGVYQIITDSEYLWADAENMMAKLKAAGYDAFITTKSGTVAGTAKKSAAEIAKEIYNGTCSDARWSSWGNGADRVNRLKQAGYDPSEVQSEVNKLF
jgi:phage uncharacterized protein (putative large terminase), C-terminal domain